MSDPTAIGRIFVLASAGVMGLAGLLWARSVVARLTDLETTLGERLKSPAPLPPREPLHSWCVKMPESSAVKPNHRYLIGRVKGFDTENGQVPVTISIKGDMVHGTFEHNGKVHRFKAFCDLDTVETAFMQSYAYALADDVQT